MAADERLCDCSSIVAGASLASSFILNNSVPLYLSIYLSMFFGISAVVDFRRNVAAGERML